MITELEEQHQANTNNNDYKGVDSRRGNTVCNVIITRAETTTAASIATTRRCRNICTQKVSQPQDGGFRKALQQPLSSCSSFASSCTTRILKEPHQKEAVDLQPSPAACRSSCDLLSILYFATFGLMSSRKAKSTHLVRHAPPPGALATFGAAQERLRDRWRQLPGHESSCGPSQQTAWSTVRCEWDTCP